MFLIKRKKTKIVEEDVAETVVSNKDTIILGRFCFTGVQKGDFFVKDTATVDLTAIVEGNITATDCVINGLVKGNVFCVNSLQLGNSAVIEGSILAKKATMETGCRVNGMALLAPKVEVATLTVKIIEAEKILIKEKDSATSEVVTKETDILQKDISIPDTRILPKEQKPELSLAQSVDNNDNWW